MMSRNIGLYGGSFDPVHVGHMTLASNVYSDFKLDKLIFIPSKNPPHKDMCVASDADRAHMLKLCLNDMKGNFEISLIELKRDGLSYTYLTLEHFKAIYEDCNLYFLCGSDIFATIDTWKHHERLFELANFVVVNRDMMPFDKMCTLLPETVLTRLIKYEDYSKMGDDVDGYHVIMYEMDKVPLSSSDVRSGVCDPYSGGKLSPEVLKYIEDKELYPVLER